MNPEDKARQHIDRQLSQAGWILQDHRHMNLSAGPGIAVREFPLKTGSADYLLYLDRRAAGRKPAEARIVVIEAKPVGHTLHGVEIQSARYTTGRESPVRVPRRYANGVNQHSRGLALSPTPGWAPPNAHVPQRGSTTPGPEVHPGPTYTLPPNVAGFVRIRTNAPATSESLTTPATPNPSLQNSPTPTPRHSLAEPLPVVYNAKIPIETFDFIIG